MNKPITIALLAAGALVAYNAFAKGTAATRLIFFPDTVYSFRFANGAPEITFTIRIQNTSNQVMQMNSLAGNLYSNDYLIGNISARQGVRIQPNSEVVLKVTARLQVIGIVAEIIRTLQGTGTKHVIEFVGNANVDRFQVPVNIKYSIG